jgi:hypothetical protein
MIIFHYHPVTGEYLGESAADESPLEEGVYLLPANSVSDPPPPTQEGFSVRFVDGSWQQIPVEASEEPAETEPVDLLDLPLSRLTFWLAATEVGVYKPNVRSHIDAMAEGPAKYEAIVWFEEATVYRRNDPLLIQLAAAEGITEPQLDALWVWAQGNPA